MTLVFAMGVSDRNEVHVMVYLSCILLSTLVLCH